MSFESGASGPAYTLVICDQCGATEEYDDGRVHVVADMATAQGWEIQSNDHALCSDCVLGEWVVSDDFTPDPATFIDDPSKIRAHLAKYGVFAAAEEEFRKLDEFARALADAAAPRHAGEEPGGYDDPAEIRRRLDDLGELVARDREIDARVSPIGELIQFELEL